MSLQRNDHTEFIKGRALPKILLLLYYIISKDCHRGGGHLKPTLATLKKHNWKIINNCPLQSGVGVMEMPGIRPLVRPLVRDML